jgi:hypothetical protein
MPRFDDSMEADFGHSAFARLKASGDCHATRVAEWAVVDHPFNVAWYPELVGHEGVGEPPSYALVKLAPKQECVAPERLTLAGLGARRCGSDGWSASPAG